MYEQLKGAETALRILSDTELDGRKIFLRKVGVCNALWVLFQWDGGVMAGKSSFA